MTAGEARDARDELAAHLLGPLLLVFQPGTPAAVLLGKVQVDQGGVAAGIGQEIRDPAAARQQRPLRLL